jgi:peptide chain release factor 1
MGKELLFSITAKDFDVQYFCVGGHGGQNMQKNATACRIVHKESGATGLSRDERSQLQNRKKAFERCVATKQFKDWHRMEVARRTGRIADAQEYAEQQMKQENLKVERYDNELKKWVDYDESTAAKES